MDLWEYDLLSLRAIGPVVLVMLVMVIVIIVMAYFPKKKGHDKDLGVVFCVKQQRETATKGETQARQRQHGQEWRERAEVEAKQKEQERKKQQSNREAQKKAAAEKRAIEKVQKQEAIAQAQKATHVDCPAEYALSSQ